MLLLIGRINKDKIMKKIIGSIVGNFYIIDLIDKIGFEKIYKVQCVCKSIGSITESGLNAKISCGCTNIIGPHRIGLSVHCYQFIRFLGDNNGRHLYEISCNNCRTNSIVHGNYGKKLCPSCPRSCIVNGIHVKLDEEAKRIGIHRNALRQRFNRMRVDEAIVRVRSNVGGKKGIHGKVWFHNILDSIPNHLKRINKINKRAFVYYWIRKGTDPSIAIQMAVDGCRPAVSGDFLNAYGLTAAQAV